MGRNAKLRTKNGHWYSEAGGTPRYFGRVSEIPREEALRRWRLALVMGDTCDNTHSHSFVGTQDLDGGMVGTRKPRSRTRIPKGDFLPSDQHQNVIRTNEMSAMNYQPLIPEPITLNQLITKYLDWLKANRSQTLQRESKRHLERFSKRFGKFPVTEIQPVHVEDFQQRLFKKGYDPGYVQKHLTSIKSCLSKGKSKGWIPQGIDPFATVDPIRIPPKPLLESDLPTPEEIQSLFDHAEPFLADLLRLYHATGARTHELIEARVGDFQPLSKTIVLGKHKRSSTLREYRPRTIALNDIALEIVQRRSEGKRANALLFPNRAGNPYTNTGLGIRFARLRKRAGVRESISIYSFRHLWVSEALMAGLDSLLVARMAGTSVQMVEKVYGHFRTQSFMDAQLAIDHYRKS